MCHNSCRNKSVNASNMMDNVTSRTNVVTITVVTFPSILTLWRLTCSSNWCMHSAGWMLLPLAEFQEMKELSTSCQPGGKIKKNMEKMSKIFWMPKHITNWVTISLLFTYNIHKAPKDVHNISPQWMLLGWGSIALWTASTCTQQQYDHHGGQWP